MPNIPVPDIVKQVRLQWQTDDATASAAVERALSDLGFAPKKKLFGGREVSPQEYDMILDWLNRRGLR